MGTFAVDLQKIAEKYQRRADQVVGDVVAQAAQQLDLRSPVGDASYWQSPAPKGYVGGQFRGSWSLGVGARPAPTVRVAPGGVLGEIVAGIPEDAAGKVFYLVNPLPYAQRIEDGWSRQAPQGLVALTTQMFPQMVDQAVAAFQ